MNNTDAQTENTLDVCLSLVGENAFQLHFLYKANSAHYE